MVNDELKVDSKKEESVELVIDLTAIELQELYVRSQHLNDLTELKQLHAELQLVSASLEPCMHREKERAQQILSRLPETARAEATAGKRFASVMKLEACDFKRFPDTAPVDAELLMPGKAAFFMYHMLIKNGLNPRITAWHERDGFKSGYHMQINW